VDTTIARAHQHAAGARKGGTANAKNRAGSTSSQPTTRSGAPRGGLSCKLHLAVEQGQRPLSIVVTAGQRGDSPQFAAVLGGIRVPRLGPGRPRTRPDPAAHRPVAQHRVSARCSEAQPNRSAIW
jgi:hypothetical protein